MTGITVLGRLRHVQIPISIEIRDEYVAANPRYRLRLLESAIAISQLERITDQVQLTVMVYVRENVFTISARRVR